MSWLRDYTEDQINNIHKKHKEYSAKPVVISSIPEIENDPIEEYENVSDLLWNTQSNPKKEGKI